MFILNKENSIANHYLAELRDVHQQQDRLRFRKNLERLGELMAYEISKKLDYNPVNVQTPLELAKEQLLAEQPVLITIMRAGVPFFQGFCNIFDRADAGFVGAYRAPHTSAEDLSVNMEYVSVPPLEGRSLVLVDPMLASGKSMIKVVETLLKQGQPKHIYIASVIAAPEGVECIENTLNQNYSLWTCALDEKLNEQAYIVPGLGDAGDLSYGPKI